MNRETAPGHYRLIRNYASLLVLGVYRLGDLTGG